MSGYKTYLVCLLGLADLVGVWLGFWPYDEARLGAYGLTGLIALRKGVKQSQPPQ